MACHTGIQKYLYMICNDGTCIVALDDDDDDEEHQPFLSVL
jgi:hypothetical protein